LLILSPVLTQAQSLLQSADSIRLTRRIPGIVFAVFSSDSILDQGAVGYKKYRTKDPLLLTDRFDIGTNTAAFTAYIAAKLVEEGKITWTTKLLDVYPEFRKSAFPVYQNITLSDLLSCRTRIPSMVQPDQWSPIPGFDGPTMSARRKAFTFFMLQQKPAPYQADPTKYGFSAAGYVIAASMLEKVSHKKWENLVVEYLSKPLKINIRYGWPNLEDSLATSGHWFQGNSFHAEDHNTWAKPSAILYPAQDINITLGDYIKFMQENLRGLLGQKTHLRKVDMEYLHYGVLDYAMGWNNGVLENVSYSFHEGRSLLFDCRAVVLKEKNRGILVLCNSSDKDARGGVLNLTRLLEAYALER
jgi:CubicO group peptidase (beta-lactamase class C family)